MASATQLSKGDRSVLSAILDPEAGVRDEVNFISENISDESYHDLEIIDTIRGHERGILSSLNTDSPSHTAVKEAIARLDELLERYPKYASGYNNRAQARRLLFTSMEDLATSPSEVSAIITDLAQAISLASPPRTRGTTSPQNARVLSSAHTHRAYLLLKWSQLKKSRTDLADPIAELASFHSEALLEMASRDFAVAGRYGNRVAKQLAVHTNPYAKLCGRIVEEALKKEFDAFGNGQ